ncbi:unnamed protein product [Acidithrix sp. C25]|nr:unnamed protein product [Acidithrix sp. C25]
MAQGLTPEPKLLTWLCEFDSSSQSRRKKIFTEALSRALNLQ